MEGNGGVRPVMRRDAVAAAAVAAVLASVVYSGLKGIVFSNPRERASASSATSAVNDESSRGVKLRQIEAGGLDCAELLRLARERRCRQLIGRVAIARRRESERKLFALLNECRDAMRRSALHIAASNGDAELIAHLVEMGGKPKMQTQPNTNTNTMKVDNNANGDEEDEEDEEEEEEIITARRRQVLLDARDRHGLTPLEYAAWRGNTAVIDMLLQYGADCHLCDNFGLTALHKSVGHNNQTATLRLLSDGGCDVNVVSGAVAEQIATGDSDKGAVLGAEDHEYIVRTNNKRQTPLHVACSREEFGERVASNEGMVALLLRWGASPNVFDADNNTPLHYAARSGDANAIRMLLKHGADATLLGGGKGESRTAFELLPEGCSAVAAEMLSEGGVGRPRRGG